MSDMIKKFLKEEDKTPSLLSNPFQKEKIKSLSINYRNSLYTTPYWYGTVEFQNGNTKGKYETEHHEEMEDVVAELKSLFTSL